MFFLSRMAQAQAPYATYIQTDAFSICSFSPELFFTRDGTDVRFKPMKGTAARAPESESDQQQAVWLAQSEKNRAENVMIVDMIRHDIGRVAFSGSVQVPSLFDIEKYPTVWQMTSTVTAKTDISMTGLWCSVFPAASITGAPKCRTMELIEQIEDTPRGVYTGSMGYYAPREQAQFNVAIRTLVVDREKKEAEYGIGGGIIWDSIVEEEYEETKTKSLVVSAVRPPFKLLESLLWTRGDGFSLLDYHLRRLVASADYFDYPLCVKKIRKKLHQAVSVSEFVSCKVRLLVSEVGSVEIELSSVDPVTFRSRPCVCLLGQSVDTQSPFIYHKTDHRRLYEDALKVHSDVDDVILINQRNELTESCYSNIALEIEGTLYTPPVSCGLLPGTYRQWMLDQNKMEERMLKPKDYRHASRVLLMNSVRGLREAKRRF